MIKVEKIQIEEFRGIRDLTLEFNGENYAICGPNGTGKSGVVDALEFALTGNISRLSGAGTGNVSVREHAPHVDSRSNPERARVTVVFKIPSLSNIQVTLVRNVKNASTPSIIPSSPEILSILANFNGHPEFVLSRREIIRYVISKPGDRSEEVQALLRLNQIGELRSNLKTIANAYEKEAKDFNRVQAQASESLAQTLEITEPVKEKVMEAANLRRAILGLNPLTDLTATTSLNDGLETSTGTTTTPKVNKTSAITDLGIYFGALQNLKTETVKKEYKEAEEELTALLSDPAATEGVSREKFLRDAINFFTEETCPVCDTKWDVATLQGIIQNKIKRFEKVAQIRASLELKLKPIVSLIDDLESAIILMERLAKFIAYRNSRAISDFRLLLVSYRKKIINFLPLNDVISAIQTIPSFLENISDDVLAIKKIVEAIPEPTQQGIARDYIMRAQDRLDTYRKAAREAYKAKQRSELANKIYKVYTEVSSGLLEKVYKDVESEFSNLYCSINSEDEEKFTAKLTPSIGKLGFDVDFYGRGHFPPGAYHSEGHQDAMGLCLYLALMKKLQGNNFGFAVLDDVLMSVDITHRREVCNLLKKYFPDTQFVLTTHDEFWLKQMNTVGLITQKNSMRFSNWTPDLGPTDWKTRDVWAEIDQAMALKDVRAAASLLRYYLEHIFKEICESLHAKVEFKGDGRYELGDTLAPAVRRFRDLMSDGAKIAEGWSKADVAENLRNREKALGESLVASNAEQWQVNLAIHYNEWGNFSVDDFAPVISTFHDLISKFFCEKPECSGLFYLVMNPPKTLDSVRCACGNTNINLKKKH